MAQIPIKQVTAKNIATEHICCAITDKKCKDGYNSKKEWLKQQFKDGYVFKKLDVRGKVFIEYVPAEKGWIPIEAKNYMLINCFWVSGKYKGQGYGRQLLQEAINAAKSQNMEGIAIVVASKKQPFMSDKKFIKHQGFELCDTAMPYFELFYKPFNKSATPPKFKDFAKKGECDHPIGLTAYYTPACPFNDYWVNTELKRIAQERSISLKIVPLDTREKAQNHFVPHTLYSVFYNGKFVTQHVLTEKGFDKYITPLVN